MKILIYVAAAIVLAVALLWGVTALSQEGHTHEGDVGKFYQTWMRPDFRNAEGGRGTSCCNNVDCRPAAAVRRRGDGQFEVQVYDPNLLKRSGWYLVPNKMWEDSQSDPRESPDGRVHVCIRSGAVICAVRGSDI